MVRRLFALCLTVMLSLGASIALAGGVELSFVLGMKDGSESSDGVTVMFAVEGADGSETEVFNEHWADQTWSDPFVVDLSDWSGEDITLKLTTDPGVDRNTGWDWILIADAKVVADGQMVYDIGQAVADVAPILSVLFDDEDAETEGLANGASSSPDVGPVGGEAMDKSFMQHVPWDGKVGNTISRYEMSLPAVTAAVEADGKVAATWGQIKGE